MSSFSYSEFDLFQPTEEHSLLRKTVRDFSEAEIEPQAAKYDREEQFNGELFRKLGGLGLLGITVPEEFGGAGMDPLAVVIAHEEISTSDPGFCLAYLAHALLCVNNLCVNGSESQKREFLPKLCSGEHIGAMGMSEPDAGTDVLGMKTRAREEDDGFVVNGRKMWITNGCVDDGNTPCDCLLFYARTDKESDEKAQLSSFLVSKGTPGFSVGQKIRDKLGMRASNTAEMCFDDCRIPLENLVGKPGESLLHMMRNLEIERVGLAAMSLGIARRSLSVMMKYAEERKAFGRKLKEFGQIQEHIATSFAEYKAARTYVYDTARRMKLDREGTRLDSDGVKLFATPIGKKIADRAIQVLGGYGYVGEYVVERLWRDSKLLEIGGGTLEAHQKNITKDLYRDGAALR
ncbi:MAG: acyl-CoA dehydrogenase family protein [Bdellovibrionales bacterium]|nr:acyl-CoA dehydrogenase family protein [Bdellovibrionales bacterium]